MQSFAVLALLAASVSAGSVHNHHMNLHEKKSSLGAAAPADYSGKDTTYGCTTYTTTVYGAATLVQDKPKATTYSASKSTSTSTWLAPTPSSTSTKSSRSSSSTTSTSSWSSSSTSTSPTSTSSTSTSSTSTSSTSSTSTTSTSSSSTWIAPTHTYVAPSTHVAPSAWAASSSASPAPGGILGVLKSTGDALEGIAASISTNGNQWAMTYTPYANDGSCKSASDVSSDIASIAAKGFTTVRIYATDCSGPENVGAAIKSNGMKLILGIYIDGEGIGGKTDEQISDLTQWGSSNWDIVEMVVAGNEAIFNGYCSASELASFVLTVKAKFSAAGYSGPVTTTEPLGTIQANAATICSAVDVIAANIHPFFNSAVEAAGAGAFVATSLSDLAGACNNEKEAYNLETGWPSSGMANGAAVPGSNHQKIALESIVQHAGSKSAVFSFENDEWKAPGDLDVEQFWGCANLFSG